MSLIKKKHQITVPTTIKALVYGQPGTRKTTLALSSPRPLLVDTDGGVSRVHSVHRSDTIQVEKYEDVLALFEENLSDYDTIIFDTAGKLLDYMSDYIIRTNPKNGYNGQLTLQGYGVRKSMFKNLLDRAASIKKHIIFVAHEIEQKVGEDKVIRPEIGGSSAADLLKELDLVGYVEMMDKVPTVSFNAQQKFYAKNSCNLESIYKLGDTIDNDGNVIGKNAFFTDVVVRKFMDKVDAFTKEQQDYSLVLDNMEAIIGACDNAAQLNEAVKQVKEFDGHMFDSQLQAKHKIVERARKIGATFNKETGLYEMQEV